MGFCQFTPHTRVPPLFLTLDALSLSFDHSVL
jgi:hypothetical protein